MAKSQDNPVIREILRQGKNKPKRLVAAALETGRIESNFTNLPGGDADSVNWRQERASIYGGDMSIRRSVARFYKEAEQLDRGQPSYELAADVQRPAEQYRGRYKTAHGEALRLLKGAGAGSPGGSSPGAVRPQPSSPQYTTSTTPGVDNSALRRQLVGQFLQGGGVANSQAVLALAAGYGQAADVPGTTTTTRVKRQPSSRSASSKAPVPKSSDAKYGPIGGPLLESFYNGPGGVNVDEGRIVPRGFVSGHTGHVHVAAGPKTVVSLGKLAQSMGLTVRENPAFDKVDPVHTEGSFHYRNQAIDVSGDPKKMAAFSRRVARLLKAKK